MDNKNKLNIHDKFKKYFTKEERHELFVKKEMSEIQVLSVPIALNIWFSSFLILFHGNLIFVPIMMLNAVLLMLGLILVVFNVKDNRRKLGI